jgi:hypothetical protein
MVLQRRLYSLPEKCKPGSGELSVDIQGRTEGLEAVTREYSVTIDGVVELQADADSKLFFDGLLDAVIDYVEKHQAIAGLAMSHREYADWDESDSEEWHGPICACAGAVNWEEYEWVQ